MHPEEWESGFFDRGSFDEILAGWAQTVICGRARLGGIPVGVISVETRSVEVNLPADPANLDSEAKNLPQAGQVLFENFDDEHLKQVFCYGRFGTQTRLIKRHKQFMTFVARSCR